jgi:hypothetical protein
MLPIRESLQPNLPTNSHNSAKSALYLWPRTSRQRIFILAVCKPNRILATGCDADNSLWLTLDWVIFLLAPTAAYLAELNSIKF